MKKNEIKIKDEIEAVLNFCNQYNKQNTPLVTGTGRVRIVCQHLNKIRESILAALPHSKFPKLDSSISWGSGKFPRVPWIGFHILGNKVSNSLSVVICFSRDGRGMVVGLMSATALKTVLKTVIRDHNPGFLDVSSSSKTRYNNKFINPEEFFSGKYDSEDLVGHIVSSLDMLYHYKSEASI
jgi:hypothetical protein